MPESVPYQVGSRTVYPYTEERDVAVIQGEIQKLSHKGIQFQVCGVALHGMDVSPGMLIPGVTPVGNGFISTIAYQEKGYALVPVY